MDSEGEVFGECIERIRIEVGRNFGLLASALDLLIWRPTSNYTCRQALMAMVPGIGG
jgi:hypothetical protein